MLFPGGQIRELLSSLVTWCQGTGTGLACHWSNPVGTRSRTLTLHSDLNSSANKFRVLHPPLHSMLLWATVQERNRYKLRLIDAIDCRETLWEGAAEKKSPGPWTRWGVTAFTPPTATSAHAVGWLTRASCTASGGAVIARTRGKHRYMVCGCWLHSWKFTFTTFPR